MSNVQIYLLILYLINVCAWDMKLFSNFTNKSNYPKCCNISEAFNERYECIDVTENKDYYQVTKVHNFNTTNNDLYCIDAIVDKSLIETGVYQGKINRNLTITLKGNEPRLERTLFYPKCCPLMNVYDPQLHRCIPNENATSVPLDILSWYIKTGLSQCKHNHVILDFLLSPNEELILHDNKSITLDGTLYRYGSYCLDQVTEEVDVVRVCRPQEEVCLGGRLKARIGHKKKIRCIKKCCLDGQSYQKYNGKNTCMASFKFGVDITNKRFNYEAKDTLNGEEIKNDDELEQFAILSPILIGRYLAKDSIFFYVDKFGTLHSNEQKQIMKKFYYDEEKYCVEYYNNAMRFFFSSPKTKNHDEGMANQVHIILLIISIVFVTITIVAYIFLPKMLNLHGKITLSHCLSLLLLDILLIVLKLNRAYGELCVLLGFSVLFASLSVFCWLNIIGFDIWYNIGSMRIRGIQRKEKEIRKFLFYCGYGWIVPLIFTTFAYSAYSLQYLPYWATPHMGKSICYFVEESGTYDYYIFYFIPFNVLLITNLVFFGRTIYYCFKVKAEINKMRNAGEEKGLVKKMLQADKESTPKKAAMLCKLLIVMGVTWFFEVLSLIIDNEYSFPIFILIFDAINALQGFWIFCIYILKQKVYEAVQDMLGIKWGRRSLNRGSASDRTTTTHQIYISKTATPKDHS